MTSSLVGSEMCIRDRVRAPTHHSSSWPIFQGAQSIRGTTHLHRVRQPVSYTHLTLPTICSV
eukprot:12770552-Prorocentrum_lima.AAC.1